LLSLLALEKKRKRNDPISVVLPKVAKASALITVVCHSCQHNCLKNIDNVHEPL